MQAKGLNITFIIRNCMSFLAGIDIKGIRNSQNLVAYIAIDTYAGLHGYLGQWIASKIFFETLL